MAYFFFSEVKSWCTVHNQCLHRSPGGLPVTSWSHHCGFSSGWTLCLGQLSLPLESPGSQQILGSSVHFFHPREAHKMTPSLARGAVQHLFIRAPKQPGPHLSRRVGKTWQSSACACNTLTNCFPYYPISSPLPLYLIMTTDPKFDAADTENQRYQRTQGETALADHRTLILQATNKTTDPTWEEVTMPAHFTEGMR